MGWYSQIYSYNWLTAAIQLYMIRSKFFKVLQKIRRFIHSKKFFIHFYLNIDSSKYFTYLKFEKRVNCKSGCGFAKWKIWSWSWRWKFLGYFIKYKTLISEEWCRFFSSCILASTFLYILANLYLTEMLCYIWKVNIILNPHFFLFKKNWIIWHFEKQPFLVCMLCSNSRLVSSPSFINLHQKISYF